METVSEKSVVNGMENSTNESDEAACLLAHEGRDSLRQRDMGKVRQPAMWSAPISWTFFQRPHHDRKNESAPNSFESWDAPSFDQPSPESCSDPLYVLLCVGAMNRRNPTCYPKSSSRKSRSLRVRPGPQPQAPKRNTENYVLCGFSCSRQPAGSSGDTRKLAPQLTCTIPN